MTTTTVMVQNAAVHVIDEGAGTPTLFLHGNPDSGDMWRAVIDRLRGRFRCLAPDLPGYGRSAPQPKFKVSLENEARWVDALVDALDVRAPLNLVVHDFGGHFGLAWAIRHPERVRRLAVFNTNFFSDYRWHPLAQMLRTPLLGELGLAAFNEAQYRRQLQTDAPRLPADYAGRALALYSPAARQMTLRLYRGTDARNFVGWEDELRALGTRVPVAVLWGDRDPYAPVSLAERFGAQRVIHFPEHSHWLPVETPEAVAAQLDEFLG